MAKNESARRWEDSDGAGNFEELPDIFNSPEYTPHEHPKQPPIWQHVKLAQRYRLSLSHARIVSELSGFGREGGAA